MSKRTCKRFVLPVEYFFVVIAFILISGNTGLCQDKAIHRVNNNTAETLNNNGDQVLFPPDNMFHDHDSNAGVLSAAEKINSELTDTDRFEVVPGPGGGNIRYITRGADGWLYLGTDGEVYRSSDNGKSWDMNLFPSQLHNFVGPVTVLAPGVIVAETDFSNFISWDRGESWSFINDDINGLVVDSNGVIYAGSDKLGVRVSVDTAKTWEPFALPGKKIYKVILCGEGRFICRSDSGTYYSSDNGETWDYKSKYKSFGRNPVCDNRGYLYARGDYGPIDRSTDFGSTWEGLSLPVDGDVYRVYTADNGNVVVAIDSFAVVSKDAGETWQSYKFFERVLTAGYDIEGNLLAGGFNGLHRFNEETGKWEDRNNGIHARRIEAIGFTPSGTIVVISLGKCFISSDSGINWEQVDFGRRLYINSYPNILVTGDGSIFIPASYYENYEAHNGVYRSLDDGKTWQWLTVTSDKQSITGLVEGNSGELFAASYKGNIYRSLSNGDSWSRVYYGMDEATINFFAAGEDSNYYVSRDSSILFSQNGTDWESFPIKNRIRRWESLSVDSFGEIYLGTTRGVYKSGDNGKTLEPFSRGLYDDYIMSSAADDSGNVVVGTGSGPFRLADSLDRWQNYNKGFPKTFTTSVGISPEGYAYAGTQSFGMYKSIRPLGTRAPEPDPGDLPPGPVKIAKFRLDQNYPNPFNGITSFSYRVSTDTNVEIKIFNSLGQEVETLFQGVRPEGIYTESWVPRNLASGVYICRVKAVTTWRTFQDTIKLLYLK